MKYFSLVWSALFRSKTRTLLTLLSVTAAFLLFGLLDSVRVAFNSGGSVAGADRLVVASRLSITQMLPYSLQQQLESTPGVKQATYAAWFGGIYQDQRNFFPNFSVGPGYFDMYPEYEMPKEQMAAFEADRTGAVVGKALADRFGWKIGDTIPLQATIFPNRDGSNDWPLTLRGVFTLKDSKRKGEENQLMFHWKYFDEANQYVNGQVGWYMVRLDNADHATRVARSIDALSENSDRETKTQTEQAFNQSFAKQFADIGLIVTAIMGAVFFTLLLLTGNTMAQAVRERIPELATLKTLGFTNGTVLVLVLVEAVLLIVLGGLLGMALAGAIVPIVSAASGGIINLPGIPGETWLVGLVLMVAIGLVIGTLPALRAMRLKIVDALAGR
ncbi:MAG: FtsX-like permease family protein [Xanthomonadales bacterium]|nr:ABC transporter permease [Pseudoxanthomonas sp.]MDZ3799499.1 FtsX-like permease family protein [Xanthomonadales bacterium]